MWCLFPTPLCQALLFTGRAVLEPREQPGRERDSGQLQRSGQQAPKSWGLKSCGQTLSENPTLPILANTQHVSVFFSSFLSSVVRVRSHTGLLAFWDIFFEKNRFKSVDHVLTWVVWICLLLLTDLEAFLMYLGIVLCWIFVNILPQSVLAFSPSLVRSYSSWLVSSMSYLGNLCPHQTHEASALTHLWQLCSLIFRPVVYIPWIVIVYSVTGGWLFVSYLYSVINHNLLKKNFPLQGSGAFVISQGTLYTWSIYESSCF